MGNVTHLREMTDMDIPVQRVLDGAAEAGLSRVFVIGRTEDGALFAASSSADGRDNLWDMEQFKHRLLSGEFG